MADVTRQIRSEAFLDLTGMEDAITAFWRTRLPFALEARKRELSAADGDKLADYYKLLVEMRDQVRGLVDRSLTAGMSAQRDIAGESRGRMSLESTYERARAQRDTEAMKQTGMNTRQMRDHAQEVVNTRIIPIPEQEQIAAGTTAARELWNTTPGDFNTKLANVMAAAKANTEKLVQGKTGLHAEAIALQIVRDLKLIVNPQSGEERAAFDAAALSIYGTYGITPIRDEDTGEMVPPGVKRAVDVEMQTAIAQGGATMTIQGRASAPSSAPEAAQTFTEATPTQVQAASGGVVLTDPEWTTGLPADAVPVQGTDGQVYARLWNGSYILHPRTLFAGNVGAVEQFKAESEPLRKNIEAEIERLREEQEKARENVDTKQIVPDFFPKAESRLTAGASKYGAWYAKLSPREKLAEDNRRSRFLESITPKPTLSKETVAADEKIQAAREAEQGPGAASRTQTEIVQDALARKKAVIATLSNSYQETEAEIKRLGLGKDDAAAKEARGRWFIAYMEATKDIPPSAQEAFADRLSLPPEARKAVATIIKGRLAPDAATRAADADEAIRTNELERNVDAATSVALEGDLGPNARTQGERDFKALAEKGAATVARNYAQLAAEADVVGGTMREYLAGFEDAALAESYDEEAGRIDPSKRDIAVAVKAAPSKEPRLTPDKRTYVKLAPEGGSVSLETVAKAWEPNKRPFVGKPGKALEEDDLIDEGEKNTLRSEYDALMGDEIVGADADPEKRAMYGEEREAYVEAMMEQRKKEKESKNAAKP